MRLGVHVSIAGGLLEALERANRLSCGTIQIFSRSPRGGPAPALPPDDLARFRQRVREADYVPLVVHAPYILNLAAPDASVYQRSLALYREEYRRCLQIGARYLVTHVGSHRGEGEAAGITRVAAAVDKTLAGAPEGVMVLLENTAGSGQGLGYSFEQLAAMREQMTERKRVGICLDTAHLFASGYAIHTADGLEDTVAKCDAVLGLSHVKLIHLNESKVAFNSRVDRHWHIGEGHIGREAMERIVNQPRLRDLPWILETPKDSDDDDLRNLATVRALRGQRSAVAA